MLDMFKGIVNAVSSLDGCELRMPPGIPEIVRTEEKKISLPRAKHGQTWGSADINYILDDS